MMLTVVTLLQKAKLISVSIIFEHSRESLGTTTLTGLESSDPTKLHACWR